MRGSTPGSSPAAGRRADGGDATRVRNPLDPRNPLAGVYVATTLFALAEGALRFLVPLNLDARGLSAEAVGLVFFAFSATSLTSRGVAGVIFRPHRARRIIVAAGAAGTAAYLLTPFVSDVTLFALLMSLDGLGWGIATTCLLAMVMLCTPSSISPGVAMGWYIGFQGLAFALATTVGGVLGQAIGIQAAMLTLATLPVIAATLISLRLPPIARAADDAGVANATADANPNAPATGPGAVAAAIRRLGALPAAVWAASLVAVYLNVMNGLLQSFFPLLGLSLGLSVVQIGTLSSIRTGISSVARFGAGWLFHRVRPSRLHLPLLAVSAGTLALLPSAAGYLACAPLFALNGVSRGLLRVTTSASAMEQTPSDRTGAAAAVMTAGLDVGKMLGPLIGGLVAAAIGLDGMFRTVPLAFLVLSVGLLLISARRQAASAARREGPPLLDEPS